MKSASTIPLLASLCANLESILVGASAADLLGRATLSADPLVILPAWAWLTPLINVGRKGLGADNRPAALPIRVHWPRGSVFSVGHRGTPVLPWRLIGLGHDQHGKSRLSVRDGVAVLTRPHPPGISVVAMVTYITPAQQRAYLEGLVEAGSEARWAILSDLEPMVHSSLARANRSVAYEIGAYRGTHITSVLDDLSLDDLASSLLYGTGDTSVVSRMIDRALRPERFAKVDPLRYFVVSIHARAEEAVRTRIGDPKVGPKVRRVFARIDAATIDELVRSDAATIDELVSAYRNLYPRDALGSSRALAALTAGPEVTAGDRRDLAASE